MRWKLDHTCKYTPCCFAYVKPCWDVHFKTKKKKKGNYTSAGVSQINLDNRNWRVCSHWQMCWNTVYYLCNQSKQNILCATSSFSAFAVCVLFMCGNCGNCLSFIVFHCVYLFIYLFWRADVRSASVSCTTSWKRKTAVHNCRYETNKFMCVKRSCWYNMVFVMAALVQQSFMMMHEMHHHFKLGGSSIHQSISHKQAHTHKKMTWLPQIK